MATVPVDYNALVSFVEASLDAGASLSDVACQLERALDYVYLRMAEEES